MADTLVSMKLSAAERKESAPLASNAEGGPQYPYGLSLHLDNEAIEKLKLGIPKVGKTFRLIANVDVTSVSSHSNVGQDTRASVELQITAMCLEAPPKGDAADALYKD